MTHDREALISADPVALTQREMLLRLDARLDRFEPRVRRLEDDALVLRTQNKTIRTIAVAAVAVWPVVGFILVNLHVVSI